MIRQRKLVNPRRNSLIQRVNRSDGKQVEICRTAAEWEQRRAECCAQYGAVCYHCVARAPLHDECRPGTDIVRYPAGHAHHIDRRGLGGGNRNDALGNLVWLCKACHEKTHEPEKVLPAKESA